MHTARVRPRRRPAGFARPVFPSGPLLSFYHTFACMERGSFLWASQPLALNRFCSAPNSPLSHAVQRHDSSPARGGAKFTSVDRGKLCGKANKTAPFAVWFQQKEPFSCPLSLASLDSSPARGRAKTKPIGYCLPRVRGRCRRRRRRGPGAPDCSPLSLAALAGVSTALPEGEPSSRLWVKENFVVR